MPPKASSSSSFLGSHYPLPLGDRFVTLLDAQEVLTQLLLEVCPKTILNGASSSSSDGVSSFLFKFTNNSTHIPRGQMHLTSSFRYPTPKGFVSMTSVGCQSVLDAAGMPFVVDCIGRILVANPAAAEDTVGSSSSTAAATTSSSHQDTAAANAAAFPWRHDQTLCEKVQEMLCSRTYDELDRMRYFLVTLADFAESGWIDAASGTDDDKVTIRLSPLAKRDLKKVLQKAAEGGDNDDDASGGKKGGSAAAATAAPSTAAPAKPERNLKALLADQCEALWPYTPTDKALKYTVENDPKQPRHKPKFRAKVEVTTIKQSFEGSWETNKRDAENAAAQLALAQLVRLAAKKGAQK